MERRQRQQSRREPARRMLSTWDSTCHDESRSFRQRSHSVAFNVSSHGCPVHRSSQCSRPSLGTFKLVSRQWQGLTPRGQDYRISPIFAPAEVLARFPPVYMSCGERDPFVDDVRALPQRTTCAHELTSLNADGHLCWQGSRSEGGSQSGSNSKINKVRRVVANVILACARSDPRRKRR